MISFQRHTTKYGNTFADWDSANRSDAQQILASVTSFEFIVIFMTLYWYLSHLAGITVKLQKRALDIIGMICEISQLYKREREDVDNGFCQIYAQNARMAEKVDTIPDMPRITARQQHCSNASSSSPEEYFKRNITIPFLDHVICCIDQKFSQSATTVSSLLGTKDLSLEKALVKYSSDLPSPELFNMELKRWKSHYMAMPSELGPASPAKAIKDSDSTLFPNINVLLQIACTIPVTSCECERSASSLWRLNNYMRASMGKDRLSYLALLHIEYETPINFEDVVDCYASLHPRRLELDSLLC